MKCPRRTCRDGYYKILGFGRVDDMGEFAKDIVTVSQPEGSRRA